MGRTREKEHKENVLAIALPGLAEPGVSLLAPKIDFGTVLYHEKITACKWALALNLFVLDFIFELDKTFLEKE